MEHFFSPVASDAIATLSLAVKAMIIASFTTGLLLLTGSLHRVAAKYYVPILVAVYALPPFVTVVAGSALHVEGLLPVIQTAAAITFPLAVQAEAALTAIQTRAASVYGGPARRRVLSVGLPFALPTIIRGFATVLPWLVLAAALAEIANSTSAGLGVKLMGRLVYGWDAAVPFIAMIAVLAVTPYAVLSLTAWLIQTAFRLDSATILTTTSETRARLRPLAEACYLALLFALLWGVVHQNAALIAPGPRRFIDAAWVNGGLIGSAAFQTVIASLGAALAGSLLGLVAAMAARLSFIGRLTARLTLLPLQVFPLIVFVPLLLTLQEAMESWLWEGAVRAPPGIRGVLPGVLISFSIGSLAAAYAAFEVGFGKLNSLPVVRGAMFESRGAWDYRLLKHVHIPWLLRALPAAIEISMPRVVLAVLVTENLVTHGGLGGRLWDFRGRSAFAETWVTVVGVLLVLVALLFAARSASDRMEANSQGV